jgi:hypothetical protein
LPAGDRDNASSWCSVKLAVGQDAAHGPTPAAQAGAEPGAGVAGSVGVATGRVVAPLPRATDRGGLEVEVGGGEELRE